MGSSGLPPACDATDARRAWVVAAGYEPTGIAGGNKVIGIVTMTLRSVYVLKKSGTLPQNVNYALKVDYALPLVEAHLRDGGPQADGNTIRKEIPDIVEESESSVVLIITK